MKINNISPQINFKQVIQIEMSNEESYAPHRYINSNKELVSVLNNKKSGYSKDEAKAIKAFFSEIYGKNVKNIALERVTGEKFLTTDAQTTDINNLKQFNKQVKGLFTPKLNSWFGGIVRSTHPGVHIRQLKESTDEYVFETIRGICKYSDQKNKNTSIKITKDPQEERFSFFEVVKQEADGTIKTKTLNLNA